jgi:hypothetical protein
MCITVQGKVPGVSVSVLEPPVAQQFASSAESNAAEPIADEVAHDLVNKLTVIKCWSEVMLRRGLATGKGVEYLHNILTAVDRSVTLSEKLHACNCRRPPGDEKKINV